MKNRIIAFALMCHMLAGSIVLPLGDFSLLKDLPRMYRAYEKVAVPEDRGILDFVGDYLLGGKALLGHNKNDQPEKSGAIQFHAAHYTAVVHPAGLSVNAVSLRSGTATFATFIPGEPGTYHPSLLRPPLA